MTHNIDILGIGNAIVDVLGYCTDVDLDNRELKKGSMSLIDEAQADALYAQLKETEEHSGGSVANSIAALANLGLKTGFVGKVRDDQLGDIFAHDLKGLGVEFDTPRATDGPATARCLIHVTQDAERTMATYLGACVGLAPEDINQEQLSRAAVTYIEGYLWDSPAAIEAIEKAIDLAQAAGNKVAFTLSDVFCVDRHRDAFLGLAAKVDILFANESELLSLYKTNFLEEALTELSKVCKVAAITMGGSGAIVLTPTERFNVATKSLDKIEDTTGAGDLFAAGLLYGIGTGKSLAESAQIGNIMAGHIIQQLGARSMKPLADILPKSAAA